MDIPSPACRCGKTISLAQLVYPHLRSWHAPQSDDDMRERLLVLLAAMGLPANEDDVDATLRGLVPLDSLFQGASVAAKQVLSILFAPYEEGVAPPVRSIPPELAFRVLGVERQCCRDQTANPPLVPACPPQPPPGSNVEYLEPYGLIHHISYRANGTMLIRSTPVVATTAALPRLDDEDIASRVDALLSQ